MASPGLGNSFYSKGALSDFGSSGKLLCTLLLKFRRHLAIAINVGLAEINSSCNAEFNRRPVAQQPQRRAGSRQLRPRPRRPAQTWTGEAKTTSQCNAEYAANKAAIKASGQTKRDFVTARRAGPRAFRRAIELRRRPCQLP